MLAFIEAKIFEANEREALAADRRVSLDDVMRFHVRTKRRRDRADRVGTGAARSNGKLRAKAEYPKPLPPVASSVLARDPHVHDSFSACIRPVLPYLYYRRTSPDLGRTVGTRRGAAVQHYRQHTVAIAA